MNLTQLIKAVLDKAYSYIDLPDETAKNAAIKTRLGELSHAYRQLTKEDGIAIDYSDPVSRFAYIYKYTIGHADYIMQIIRRHEELTTLFDEDELDVACIGGGPGSDFLGVLKYMLKRDKKLALTCYLFDRERSWGDSWSGVAKVLKPDFPIYPVFQQLDVTDRSTWSAYNDYLNSRLFTLSYFMSEVYKFRDTAEPYFAETFDRLTPGTKVLFVDNRDQAGRFVGWFDELAAAHNLEILVGRNENMSFSNDEEKTDLGEFFKKFDWPKRTSDLVYRIAQKQ
ncbi:hypothetical protein [Stieleria varia]|uniref:Class I SAM-dependent methyltransferase n=1 Tax=Stieleria varia TaxID=2528005 RepID=A0A5C6AXK9_9BACT|nr:hypothetical protein [Stieleria varia]TWU02864.1 hypothetical protein Pla52n_39240 [Stieleria varia]